MKKINKRACRVFADPHLKMNEQQGLLITDKVSYIVRTAIKNISGQRLLLIYVYSREQAASGTFTPLWTIFQSRTEYWNLKRKEDGSLVWRCASFKSLNYDYNFEYKCAFYSLQDRERLDRYCKGTPKSGFFSLLQLQTTIRTRQCMKKQLQKERKILQRLSVIPALPRGLTHWIHNEIMQTFLFYDYQRSKAPQKAYCTTCQKEVLVTGAKHSQEGICPKCHRKAIFKARGKRGYIESRETCQVIQQIRPDELIIRIIKVYYLYRYKDTPRKIIVENARCFIRAEEDGSCKMEPFYDSYRKNFLTSWKYGMRPALMNKWSYHFEGDICGHLYTKNLDKELLNTPWQYCQLRPYYEREQMPLTCDSYLKIYLKYPLLEYLVKLGLYRLADYLVNHHSSYSRCALNMTGNNIQEILGIKKEYFPFVQAQNPDNAQLLFIQDTIQASGFLDKEFLEWCETYNVQNSHIIQFLLGYTSSLKLMHYAQKQYDLYAPGGDRHYNMDHLLTTFRDYLNMCLQLEYDLTNDFVLFPRYLEKSHDKVTHLIKKRNMAIYNKQIKEQFPVLQKLYQFKHKDYMIVVPRTAKEITKEGHTLHHCVGSYISSVARQQCTILFVRSKAEPKKPLCTVEIRNNAVMQARCLRNQDPSDEIKAFLNLWKKRVLQKEEQQPFAA